LRAVIDSLAALLVPSDCRICTRPLVRLSRLPVCDLCLSSLVAADGFSCSLCGERLDYLAQDATPLCGVCRRLPPRFDFAISFGAYDGALRKLVHLLKYERLRPAAEVLGGKLAQAVGGRHFEYEQPALVVPVPLHRSKGRQRGFNQSELIAQAALKRLPVSRFELHSDNLRRVRATESQTGLTRHQRRENVRGAFVAAFPERLRERSVLIVDDVYTTGTTLNECARVVRAAGAGQVVVATVARVYRPTAQLLSGSASNQEEHAAVLAGAAAG
jgi:ComF family protein